MALNICPLELKSSILINCFFIFSIFAGSDRGLYNPTDNSSKNKLLHVEYLDKVKQQEDSIIEKGAMPQLISNQFTFTEGPAVDKEGNIFFTDQPNNKIWKYDTDRQLSVFKDKTGRSNGMYFDNDGKLITCADELNQLWSIDAKGRVTVVLRDFQGHRFNGPNDLWIDKKGGIYFTDPYYQRPYWDRKVPDIKGEKVYYLPKGKSEAIIVADDLLQPNGIVGTPDGEFLYVADIKEGKTYRYNIRSDGSLRNKAFIIEQGSDGMTLDNKGNIYLTGNGVTIYSKDGKKIINIPIPAKWTANVCFGGKMKNMLFITASESIFTLAMQVKGVE
jgi:gluconolactonase